MSDNEQNPFDLDLGFETETESGTLATLLLQFLKWFILGLSAVTTGAFFFEYAGDAFSFLFGSASPWVTGVVGATALDGLSQVWAYLRGHKANTMKQMTAARLMSWANLLASVVVTVVYLALTAAFDIGVTAADGSLTQLGYTLNLVGVLIMIGSISGNFIAYHWYNDSDINNQQAVQRTTLAATINQGRHFIETQRVEGVMVDTLKDIMAQLPEQTRQAGEQNKDSYFKRHFGRTSPRPSPNGRPVKTEQTAPSAPEPAAQRRTPPPDPENWIWDHDALGSFWTPINDPRHDIGHQRGWATEDGERPAPLPGNGRPVSPPYTLILNGFNASNLKLLTHADITKIKQAIAREAKEAEPGDRFTILQKGKPVETYYVVEENGRMVARNPQKETDNNRPT